MPIRRLLRAARALLLATPAVTSAATLTLPQQADVSQFGDGISVTSDPSLAGTVVADLTTHFSYEGSVVPTACQSEGCGPRSGQISGSVESRVVRNAGGHDDFYWRISVDPGSFNWVQAMTLSGLPPGTYTIDWRSDDGGGAPPGYAATFTPGVLSLEWIQPLDRPAIAPGDHSPWLVLRTDATSFVDDASLVLFTDSDGPGEGFVDGQSASIGTFAPAAPVPEPAGRALLAMGLLVIVRLWRQRGRPPR